METEKEKRNKEMKQTPTSKTIYHSITFSEVQIHTAINFSPLSNSRIKNNNNAHFILDPFENLPQKLTGTE